MKSPSDTRLTILTYYLTFVFMGMVVAATGPLLPAFAEKYQVSLSQVSLVFPAHSLGYTISSFFGGNLYDRFKGHHLLIAVTLLNVSMISLLPFIPTFWIVLVIFFAVGFAVGGMDLGCNILLVWKLREKSGPYMNGLHFFFGLGALFSPLIITRAADLLGSPVRSYWLLAAASLPALFLLIPRPSPVMPPPPADHQQADRRPHLFLVLALVFFFFLHVGSQVSYGNWVYSYTLHTQVQGEKIAAYLNSAFWAAITVGRLMAIPITMRVKISSLLIGSLITGITSLLVIVIWPLSAIALWVSTIGAGLSIATLFPSTLTFLSESIALSGKTTGYILVGGSLGAMVLPWLIGQLFEPMGPRSVMIVIGIALFTALLVFAWVLRYLRNNHPASPVSQP